MGRLLSIGLSVALGSPKAVRSSLLPVTLALGLLACAPPVALGALSTTIVSPSPDPDTAVVKSVQTYLHTFRLNEKDLPAGLTIPYGFPGAGLYVMGTATTTGRTGPQGHEVYEVGWVMCDTHDCGGWYKLVEIAPDVAPAGPSASSPSLPSAP